MNSWYSRARRAFTPSDSTPADKSTTRSKRTHLVNPADVIDPSDDESAGWWSSSLELSNGVTVIETDVPPPSRESN